MLNLATSALWRDIAICYRAQKLLIDERHDLWHYTKSLALYKADTKGAFDHAFWGKSPTSPSIS